MVRLDRSRKAGPLLEWKVRLFSIGAVLGLSGIFTEERWLTGTAIAVLAVAGLTRFFPGGEEAHPDDDDGEEEDGRAAQGP